MAYTKKTWVNVPDPSNYEGDLSSLPRFDAENMNRIEEGIASHIADAVVHNNTRGGGGAVGIGANTSPYGGSVGYNATSKNGGAVGSGANVENGGAVGNGARAINGGAVGYNARTSLGAAIGSNAQTVNASGNVIDAVQLGSGTNKEEKTLQVYDKKLLNADGTIPDERIPRLGAVPTPYTKTYFQSIMRRGSGFYQVDAASDNPDIGSSTWKTMLQLVPNLADGKETGNQVIMTFHDVENPKMWLRGVSSGTAGNWVEMLHTGNTSQTQIVSYVGTGTFGVDNCCQLTFNFAPRIIKFLACVEGDKQRGLDYYDRGSSTGVRGDGFLDVIVCDLLKTDGYVSIGLDDSASSDSDSHGCKSKDGKTVYWYNTSSSMGQCNYKDYTYYFMAIG